MTKVSIVTATYNMARYLPGALDSALSQSYPDVDVVVVDDGSTDNTAEVVRPYLPHVRYFRQEQQGVAAARNRALEMAKGEYVRFLDADDALCPDSLFPQVDLLNQCPQVALVYGPAHVIDSDGKVRGLRKSRFPNGAGTIVPSARAFRRLLRGCDICASTVMARMTALQRVGPFRQERVPGEDWDMWLRTAAYFDHAYIPRPLAYYRVHQNSATAGNSASDVADSHLNTLRALFARPDLPYRHLESLAYACVDRTTARVAARLRQRDLLARYLLRALRSHPRLLLEGETWNTLYEGLKLVVPLPALEAMRRLKGKLPARKRLPERTAELAGNTVEAGGLSEHKLSRQSRRGVSGVDSHGP